MKRFIALALCSCSAAFAAEAPGDFAYAMPIVTEGEESLYQVELPPALYRGIAHPDLRDVRVFNANGEVVPFALRPRGAPAAGKPTETAVPYFPLRSEQKGEIEQVDISVNKRADGTIVNIRSGARKTTPRDTLRGYLLDTSQLKEPVRALLFEWTSAPEGFAGKVRVDASDDLSRWTAIARDASLVNLEFGGHRLEQKRVEFAPQKHKYLRVSWPSAQKALPLTGVRAEFAPGTVEPQRTWVTIAEGMAAKKAGEYEYDLSGYFTFDRLRIGLPQENTVAQIEILARAKPADDWRLVASTLAYRLRSDGNELKSPDLVVTARGERYWLLRVDQKGGGIGAGVPALTIGWIPQQLVFAARGEGPFRLAYGNHAARAAAYPIASLIPGHAAGEVLRVKAAALGEPLALAGTKRLREPIDYRRWLLWASLIVGVAVLAWMAYRLSRQIARNPGAGGASGPPGT